MANYRCMGCMKEFDDNLKKCPHCSYIVGTLPAEPYFLAPETVLDGRYIVGKILGSSALTITYLAWDCLEDCKIVIKEYFPKNFSSRMPGQTEINTYDGEKAKQFESGLRAFITENTRLSELPENLEGVARTKSVFIENSTAYTVIEYLDGVSFAKVVSDNKIPWHDVVEIMKPVLISMDSVHKSGLIHYNISPDNIIMTRDKKVKLLSFGSAKLEAVGNIKNLDLITKPGFSPVELYGDEPTGNAAVDVYSIAAIMYYAITGVIPKASIERASGDTLKTPKELGIAIPANVENALMNALNVNAQNRTPDCATFMNELNSDRVVRNFEAKKKNDTGKLSKKTKIIIGIFSAIVIAAVTAIALTQSDAVKTVTFNDNLFPDLNGYTIEQVEKKLKNYNNIDFIITGTLEDDSAKPGTVLWQSIEPKTKFDENEKLTVEIKIVEEVVDVNSDADTIKMPSLIAATREDAQEILEAYGLTNYAFDTRVTYNYKDGVVCDQSIEADTKIEKDEYIIIYIAQAPEQQAVVHTTKPNKVAETTKKQEPEKEEPVTKTPATTKAPPKKPSDNANSNPKPTTTVAPTTEAKVIVPNVAGLSKDDAKSTITAAGLSPNIQFVDTTKSMLNNKVQITSPGAGSKVDENSVVTIYVYKHVNPTSTNTNNQ